MKKALSFAVALGLVAGAAAVASAAELSVSGDARVRGVYHTNYSDTNNDIQDKVQDMDQRIRVNAAIKVNDAVSVNTRLIFGDNQLLDSSDPGYVLRADRGNMVINALGGTWTLGRQEAAWGNAALPFLIKDVSKDRIKGIYKAGDMTFGGYLQKDVEGSNYGYKNGDGDVDTWAGLVMGKAGDTSWGVLLNYSIYNGNTFYNNRSADGMVDSVGSKIPAKGDTGYLIDPYFATKIGPATLLGELMVTGGDLGDHFEQVQNGVSEGTIKVGGYMAGVVNMEPVTLVGLLAYSRNCALADSHFAPSLLIGKTNETGMINFGDTESKTHNDDSSYIVGGKASFKAGDKLEIGGLLAYLSATKYGVGDNTGTLIEADVTAEYELAQNAKYKFGVGYGAPKHLHVNDAKDEINDAIWVLGNSVEVSF